MEKISVSLPLTGEYLTTVRLTTGGLCALVGFNVDESEDFKVCVTESLLILKRNGFVSADIHFTIGESLACEVRGGERGNERADEFEDEISRALLSALLGNVDFVKEENRVVKIAFEG